jgi:DNA-binding CsgD family transcriptional regulator
MDSSLPILPDSTNKREQIIKLLSEGNHSTKNIARIVGTTEAYVWKEKSKLKARGLLIRRDTEVISRRSHEALSVTASPVNGILGREVLRHAKYQSICSNNILLDVPQLDTEGLKKLYSEFRTGKKPAQIIAENGFHPELVENEYQRFSRFTEHDVDALERKFFLNFKQDLVTAKNIINPLVEKYNKKGMLTIDEFITLIKLMLNEKYQWGKASVIHDIVNGIPPDGWKVVRCMNCNRPISGVIADPTTEMGQNLLKTSIPWTHPSCSF